MEYQITELGRTLSPVFATLVRWSDAHLAAVMRIYGIHHILTFNTTDFARYAPEGIIAVNPGTV